MVENNRGSGGSAGRGGSGDRNRSGGAYRGTNNWGGSPRGFRSRDGDSSEGRSARGGAGSEGRPTRSGAGADRRAGSREGRAQSSDRSGNTGRRSSEERPAPVHNARDLRSANRQDRERSPVIDDDVTGEELDRVTRAQLRNLEEVNAKWVGKHLVMAGRLMDIDPELAFQHALAASRRGGRMALVREAVGLTAYAAGHYGEALREFRTFRRITGSNEHLPVMADCERGLGRPDRALEAVRSDEAKELNTAGKVELALVESGARADMEQYDAAVTALEIPQLDRNRAYSFSPRLFDAYADALERVDRTEEATAWRQRAAVAADALGVGDFAEPEIVDLGEDEEQKAEPRRTKKHD